MNESEETSPSPPKITPPDEQIDEPVPSQKVNHTESQTSKRIRKADVLILGDSMIKNIKTTKISHAAKAETACKHTEEPLSRKSTIISVANGLMINLSFM